jgi:hypothetical protein
MGAGDHNRQAAVGARLMGSCQVQPCRGDDLLAAPAALDLQRDLDYQAVAVRG